MFGNIAIFFGRGHWNKFDAKTKAALEQIKHSNDSVDNKAERALKQIKYDNVYKSGSDLDAFVHDITFQTGREKSGSARGLKAIAGAMNEQEFCEFLSERRFISGVGFQDHVAIMQLAAMGPMLFKVVLDNVPSEEKLSKLMDLKFDHSAAESPRQYIETFVNQDIHQLRDFENRKKPESSDNESRPVTSKEIQRHTKYKPANFTPEQMKLILGIANVNKM